MAMAGYTKLFNSILASTIWEADMPTRIVWITLLAMADKNGIAEGSVPGLATFARVGIEDCRRALQTLQLPDPDSRSQEHDGRRIEAVPGGWRLLNHAKYRAKLNDDERREYFRTKKAKWRAEHRKQTDGHVLNKSTLVKDVQDKSTLSTQAEAEAEADPKADPKAETESTRARSVAPPRWSPAKSRNGHHRHAWCSPRDGLCVPDFLHTEMLGKSAKPEAEVRAWYQHTIDKFDGRAIGEDNLQFWRNEFAAWVGTVTREPGFAKAGKTSSNIAEMHAAIAIMNAEKHHG